MSNQVSYCIKEEDASFRRRFKKKKRPKKIYVDDSFRKKSSKHQMLILHIIIKLRSKSYIFFYTMIMFKSFPANKYQNTNYIRAKSWDTLSDVRREKDTELFLMLSLKLLLRFFSQRTKQATETASDLRWGCKLGQAATSSSDAYPTLGFRVLGRVWQDIWGCWWGHRDPEGVLVEIWSRRFKDHTLRQECRGW